MFDSAFPKKWMNTSENIPGMTNMICYNKYFYLNAAYINIGGIFYKGI